MKDDVPARSVDDRDTACADSPNRPPREVVDRLIDDVAWAKTCMLIAAATAPKSPEREREMEKLRKAVIEPRRVVNEVFIQEQYLPRALIVELRTCELAIPKLEAGAILRQQPPSGDAP